MIPCLNEDARQYSGDTGKLIAENKVYFVDLWHANKTVCISTLPKRGGMYLLTVSGDNQISLAAETDVAAQRWVRPHYKIFTNMLRHLQRGLAPYAQTTPEHEQLRKEVRAFAEEVAM